MINEQHSSGSSRSSRASGAHDGPEASDPSRLNGPSGGVGGLSAPVREQTEPGADDRRQRIDVIRLLCDLADLCSGDGSLSEIARAVVRRVCEFNGFHAGRAYLLAGTGHIADDGDGGGDGPARTGGLELVAEHLDAEAKFLHARHASLPCHATDGGDAAIRTVLAGAEPVWTIAPINGDAGRGSDRAEYAVAIPIRVDDAVVGALQFFSPKRPRLPEGVREAVESVGVQLGRVAERHRLQTAIRRAAGAERTRIVQSLHATTGRELAGLAMSMDELQRRLATGAAVDPQDVEAMSDQVRRTLDGLGSTLAELVPPGLQQGNLALALEHLAEAIEALHGITCRASCTVEVADPHLAVELYGIASEAASNAARHADPTRIDVRLEHSGDGAVLEIRDDGVGLTPERASRRGMGLPMMRHRAAAFGGRMSITSIPGRGAAATAGTRVTPGTSGIAGTRVTPGTRVRCEVPARAIVRPMGEAERPDERALRGEALASGETGG